MSSRSGRLREVFPVAPGGGLVVEGAGLQASVQDADEAVGEPAERVAVVESFGALLVVEGARPGDACSEEKAQDIRASTSRSLWMNRAATTFFLPDARVIGLVPP